MNKKIITLIISVFVIVLIVAGVLIVGNMNKTESNEEQVSSGNDIQSDIAQNNQTENESIVNNEDNNEVDINNNVTNNDEEKQGA